MPHNLEEQLDTAFQLVQSNRLEEAWVHCQQLDKFFPEVPQIVFLLGAVMLKMNNPKAAEFYLQAAVRLAPEVAEFRTVLAGNLRTLGKMDDAVTHYEAALRLHPDQYNVLSDMGSALKSAGRYPDAEAAFRRAKDLEPSHSSAAIKLARLLREMGNIEEARQILQTLADRRNDGGFYVPLAGWYLPFIPTSLEEIRTARTSYENAVEQLTDNTMPINPAMLLELGTNFMAVYQGDDDRRYQETIADFYLRNCPELTFTATHIGKSSGHSETEKIRIGFVSCNFFNHTVGKLFRGIVAKLNRDKFSVSVFSRPEDDEISHFIRGNCDAHTDLPDELNAASKVIGEAELDILFYTDIGMDPLIYFLAFARLAPVQCVGWGHGVTTGLPSMDYFISHHGLEEDDPAAAQSHYSEKLIQLSQPPTYMYPIQQYDPGEAPDLSFAENRTLYCCLQTLFKVHPEFDHLLMDILKSDGAGVAVFIDGLPGWSDKLMERWRQIDEQAAERIFFVPRLNQNAFLALVDRADVILDTIHTCGGLSSAEALASGTPIVTWPNSPLLFGRVTSAYYHQIGVLDCIADSAQEYVEIAVRLGQDRKWRDQIAARIKNSRNLMFQRQEVLAELEAFLVEAHHQEKTHNI